MIKMENKKSNKLRNTIIIISAIAAVSAITFIIFIMIVVGSVGSRVNDVIEEEAKKVKIVDDVKNDKVKPDMVITAYELSRDYEENELRADKKYKGKLVKVDGEVEDISKILGSSGITLVGYEFSWISCNFAEVDEESIAKLDKGDKVSVVGYIDGYGFSVDMSKCKLK
eukprot:GHVO01006842.1.p1 GENE.GHVO01006842.1~~GHVO01006842.1.p1  ORF type:complete len:169 (+),score=5.55 GHVO01006842.1:27-533(+)